MSKKSGTQRLISVLALSLFMFVASVPVSAVDYGLVASRVANLLENEHFKDHPIDDEISKELLQNYLEFLDAGRLYFLQPEVDALRTKYNNSLDDRLLLQDISPAHEIYGIYKDHVIKRVEKIEKLLTTHEFTFDSDRSVNLTRKDMPWPATEADADQVWHNIIEGEVLQEVLRREAVAEARAEKEAKGEELEPIDEDYKKDPREIVLKRYNRILESLAENTTEDVAGFYIKSLSHAYDPHSDYFTQSEYNNFMISMRKQLQGIGALLSMTDSGYAEIRGLVVGGPAQMAGELQVGDRIVEVGQGRSGDMEDIVHMKLQDVVDLIRGDAGTIVRLKLLPAGSESAETKVIFIRRDKVDLKESLARAELIEMKDDEGKIHRIGWLDLPSFYSDMETGATSVTRDAHRLISRLMQEDMEGLIIDLRQNGGGSLEEAVNLTGLFIPKGPVVQAVDSRNQRTYKASRAPQPVYNGPLVILTSKSSASASEILAAALQDYGRAVVVGERSTFGKGTVQQLLPVTTDQFRLRLGAGGGNQAGAIKLTIQKFYRIAGGSTQRRGVIPDLILPSVTDAMELGEASLKNPLPYDEIPRQQYALWRKDALPIQQLKQQSADRIAADPDFQWVVEETERFSTRKEENSITLNKEKRQSLIEEQDSRTDARVEDLKKRYAVTREAEEGKFTSYSITLDSVNEPKLKLLSELTDEERTGMRTESANEEQTEEQKALEPPHGFREVKRESISILTDLIELEEKRKNGTLTSSQKPGGAPAPN
ncbi:MAG: carboxy terminal-processing peptidase [Verrucomicrobiota bacterium]